MRLRLKSKSLTVVLAVGMASLSVILPVTAQGQDLHHVQIANPELIVANQNCQNWCWAASSEMLVRSQGIFDVLQTEFVRRIYGPELPCLPSFGSFEPIKQAIEGIYTLPGGAQIALSGAYYYGVPTDVAGMIRSIEDGRPFIFAWQGHAWVAYGIRYFYPSPFTIQFTEIELIDPLEALSGGTRPQFYSFVVGRDNFAEINGTFELLVAGRGSGATTGRWSRRRPGRQRPGRWQ